MNEKDRNESLREVLRRGDPADGEAGLTSEEIQTMRRAVLAAVPPPRERFRLAPAFVTAAIVTLSFVVVLSLWRAQEHPPVPTPSTTTEEPPPAPSAAASEAVRPPVVTPQLPIERRHRPTRGALVARRGPSRHPVRPSAPDRPVEENPSEAPLDTPTRQVQFSTPGGTRIIWMLPETTR